MSPENNEFQIPFEESRRGSFSDTEKKAAAGRLGRYLASRAIDRPDIGDISGKRNRRRRGINIDVPTGGKPGTRKPTGSRRDVDNDGWADEGTTKPVWVGVDVPDEKPSREMAGALSSGKHVSELYNIGYEGDDWVEGERLTPDSLWKLIHRVFNKNDIDASSSKYEGAIDAIDRYKDYGETANQLLRSPYAQGTGFGEFAPMQKLLMDNRIPAGITLYRRITRIPEISELKEGETFGDRGFQSFSIMAPGQYTGQGYSRPIVLRLLTTRQTRGRYVSKRPEDYNFGDRDVRSSYFGVNEHEVLLPAGATYKLVKKTVGDDGSEIWDVKLSKQGVLSSGAKEVNLDNVDARTLGSGKTPRYPRTPTLGAFLGKADEDFDGIDSWEQFKEIYDGKEIVFFDYETTGLEFDEFGQEISRGVPVQFGAVKIKDGKEIGRINLFMNPNEPLGEWSRNNLKDVDGNPLTDEWLRTQMSVDEAHKRLIEFAGPEAIFGVQNATFDKTVLDEVLEKMGEQWRPSGYLDTREIAALTLPKWTPENEDGPFVLDKEGNKRPSSSLAAITKYLGVELGEGHHNADADAFATSQVMKRIIDGAIEKGWSKDALNKGTRDAIHKPSVDRFNTELSQFEKDKSEYQDGLSSGRFYGPPKAEKIRQILREKNIETSEVVQDNNYSVSFNIPSGTNSDADTEKMFDSFRTIQKWAEQRQLTADFENTFPDGLDFSSLDTDNVDEFVQKHRTGIDVRVYDALASGRQRPLIPVRRTREWTNVEKGRRGVTGYNKQDISGRLVRRGENDWLKGMSPSEIATVIVPQNINEHFEMWADEFAPRWREDKEFTKSLLTYFKEHFADKKDLEFDYSPESVTASRKIVQQSLESNPGLMWLFQKHGAPMYGVFSRISQDILEAQPERIAYREDFKKRRGWTENPWPKARAMGFVDSVGFHPRLALDGESQGAGGRIEQATDLMSPERIPDALNAHIDRSLEATVIHEYGHWLHRKALQEKEYFGKARNRTYYGSGKSSDRLYMTALDVAEKYNSNEKDELRIQLHRLIETGEMSLNDVMSKWGDSRPITATSYGNTTLLEAVAEGFVAVLHPDSSVKDKFISKSLRDDVLSLMGLDVNADLPWLKPDALSSGSTKKERRQKRDGRIRSALRNVFGIGNEPNEEQQAEQQEPPVPQITPPIRPGGLVSFAPEPSQGLIRELPTPSEDALMAEVAEDVKILPTVESLKKILTSKQQILKANAPGLNLFAAVQSKFAGIAAKALIAQNIAATMMFSPREFMRTFSLDPNTQVGDTKGQDVIGRRFFQHAHNFERLEKLLRLLDDIEAGKEDTYDPTVSGHRRQISKLEKEWAGFLAFDHTTGRLSEETVSEIISLYRMRRYSSAIDELEKLSLLDILDPLEAPDESAAGRVEIFLPEKGFRKYSKRDIVRLPRSLEELEEMRKGSETFRLARMLGYAAFGGPEDTIGGNDLDAEFLGPVHQIKDLIHGMYEAIHLYVTPREAYKPNEPRSYKALMFGRSLTTVNPLTGEPHISYIHPGLSVDQGDFYGVSAAGIVKTLMPDGKIVDRDKLSEEQKEALKSLAQQNGNTEDDIYGIMRRISDNGGMVFVDKDNFESEESQKILKEFFFERVRVFTGAGLIKAQFGNRPTREVLQEATAEDGFFLLGKMAVYDIRTETGERIAREALISDLIHTWAISANDSNPVALTVQHEARKLFGLDNAVGWYAGIRTRQLPEGVTTTGPDNIFSSMFRGAIGVDEGSQLSPLDFDDAVELSEEQSAYIREILKSIYESTQHYYKSKGITHIPVWRGMKLPDDADGIMRGDIRSEVTTMRPMSSWATNPAIGWQFSGARPAGDAIEDVPERSVFMKAWVPVEHVFSNALTGFGCLGEDEVVLLGHPTLVKMLPAVRTFKPVFEVAENDETRQLMEQVLSGYLKDEWDTLSPDKKRAMIDSEIRAQIAFAKVQNLTFDEYDRESKELLSSLGISSGIDGIKEPYPPGQSDNDIPALSSGKTNEDVFKEAESLGISWSSSNYGISEDDRKTQVESAVSIVKSTPRAQVQKLELNDKSKELIKQYSDGQLSLENLLLYLRSWNSRDRYSRSFIDPSKQLPYNWRVAIARQVAENRGDIELVSRIDKFQEFLDSIPSMSDDELASAVRTAGEKFGNSLSSPIVQTPDVRRIIAGRGGVTVHSIGERRVDSLQGTTGMGDAITITARRKVESRLGFPFTGEFSPQRTENDEDPKITQLRPTSGHSLPSDIPSTREKRLRSIYGDEFSSQYSFPVGSDIGEVATVDKYGSSHIALSASTRERTKIINGDSVAMLGHGKGVAADIDEIGVSGIAFGDALGMIYTSMTGDSQNSIAGPLRPGYGWVGKYAETLTLGTFAPDEVDGIFVHDLSQLRRASGSAPDGLNPKSPFNFNLIIDAAITRDELRERGIELAVSIGESRGGKPGTLGTLEYLNPDNVELFNPTITKGWLRRYRSVFGGASDDVLIPDGANNTTPYEVILRWALDSMEKTGNLPDSFWSETRDGKQLSINDLREELGRTMSSRGGVPGRRVDAGTSALASRATTESLSSGAAMRYRLYDLRKRAADMKVTFERSDDRAAAARATLRKGYLGGFTVEIDSSRDVKTGIAVARNKHGMIADALSDFDADGNPSDELVSRFMAWLDFHGPETFSSPKDGAEKVVPGGWVSEGKLYLDVVDIYPRTDDNIRRAAELGKLEDQIAVTDLDTLWQKLESGEDISPAFIDSGGTGGFTISEESVLKFRDELRKFDSYAADTGTRFLKPIGDAKRYSSGEARGVRRVRYTDFATMDKHDYWILADANGNVMAYTHEQYEKIKTKIQKNKANAKIKDIADLLITDTSIKPVGLMSPGNGNIWSRAKISGTHKQRGIISAMAKLNESLTGEKINRGSGQLASVASGRSKPRLSIAPESRTELDYSGFNPDYPRHVGNHLLSPSTSYDVLPEPTDSYSVASTTGAPMKALMPGSYPPEVEKLINELVDIASKQGIYSAYEMHTGGREEGNPEAVKNINRTAAMYRNLLEDALTGAARRGEIDRGLLSNEEELNLVVTGLLLRGIVAGIQIANLDRINSTDDRGGVTEDTLDSWNSKIVSSLLNNSPTKIKSITSTDELMENARVGIGTTPMDLVRILRDGEFKTLHETGTSRGNPLAGDARKRTEFALFGILPSYTGKRPVSGVLTVGGVTEKSMAQSRQYGPVRIVLKPSVNERTTWTEIDSLTFMTTASSLKSPSVHGLMNQKYNKSRTGFIERRRGETGKTAYTEAQVHGGVSVDDIDHVIIDESMIVLEPESYTEQPLVRGQMPMRLDDVVEYQELVQMLKARGIPITVVNLMHAHIQESGGLYGDERRDLTKTPIEKPEV